MKRLLTILLITYLVIPEVQGKPVGIQGPLPSTPAKGLLVWSVSEAGYTAEEYLISGTADTYKAVSMADAVDMNQRDHTKDMGVRDFHRTVIDTGLPYCTRVIIYRPTDKSHFSGNVVMEVLHPMGGGQGIVWSLINRFFISHGDAYIAVQPPVTFAILRDADRKRYGSLTSADPTQLWGSLADIGTLLKTGGAQSPLRDYIVRRLYMTGYSWTGVATATFADYHHNQARLANGSPVFDGYIAFANAMYIRPLDVPVIRVNTQSDFGTRGGINNRRADSDKLHGRFRLYEVAGAAHAAEHPPPFPGLKPPTLLTTPPGSAPNRRNIDCQAKFPPGHLVNDFPLYLLMSAAFQIMYDWIDTGRPPPSVKRILSGPDGVIIPDAFGNARGGVRYPQVEVPVATYGVGSSDCELLGYRLPFDADTKRKLYGNKRGYVQAVQAAVNRLLQDHLLLQGGAEEIMETVRQSESF